MTSRRIFLGLALSAAAVGAASLLIGNPATNPASAQQATVFTRDGLAVSGYDPVAYFTESKPVQGNPAIALDHGGARYIFSSEANREAFRKDPAKFAPQYGGYCAWAVSHGAKADADPTAWSIHEGRLFLNLNRSVHQSWVANLPANISRADANWPKLAEGR